MIVAILVTALVIVLVCTWVLIIAVDFMRTLTRAADAYLDDVKRRNGPPIPVRPHRHSAEEIAKQGLDSTRRQRFGRH